ncbi:P-loop containing nucleoside triphosphate hydrolase protein [Infundibulicybe gibba]|nr:P-loop containing nucleoside triphosphate hydrolase protein [Infundibulicybe gibba]
MDQAYIPGTLHAIRSLDDNDILDIAYCIIQPERLPSPELLESLSKPDHALCLRACLLVYTITRGRIVPTDFQLEAALETARGRDSVVISGTGSGKTLCIVIPLLLFPTTITITISPLKRLQMMQVKDFAEYGIETVAINEDTPHSPDLWAKISNGLIPHLIVQPEQFQLYQGHLPRLARLLHDREFLGRIRRVHVDEAHNVYISGTKRNGHPAFRPAWGSLDEVHARCLKITSWQALSATLPPHILKTVDEKLLLSPNRRLIRRSVNRPNIVYATHVLVGSISDFRNLDCIIPQPFHPPMRLPKLLIFHDNKGEANNASSYLNARLPKELQTLGICKHYHSDMSPEYLEETFSSFAEPDGATLIINGTSGAGTGLDIRGVEGVIQYGICTEIPEGYQRGGRGGRDKNGFAFFLMMVESWTVSGKNPTKQERCSIASLKLVQSAECLRQQFARYFNDNCPTALEFTGRWCCDRHVGNGFDLAQLFLGPIFTGDEPPPSIPKRKRIKYRPVKERDGLEHQLKIWLYNAYMNSPHRFSQRASLILDEPSIHSLVKVDPKNIKTPSDITQILNQTTEWESNWSRPIYKVITAYDRSLSSAGSLGHGESSDEEPLLKRMKGITIHTHKLSS